MPDGMPADCPMHAAHAKQAALTPVPASAAAPAKAPCPKPGDCCLEQGQRSGRRRSTRRLRLPRRPAVVATVGQPRRAGLAGTSVLPRELGSDRSHAPPAFNRPLRN